MALTDILAQVGDAQEFVVEIPAGNSSYTPPDVLLEASDTFWCVEIPTPSGGGGNIFIMSE
jgi:hypothetical protein